MKSNHSGMMNIQQNSDPLKMINNMGQNNSYYLSQSGPNQMNSKISQGGEPDYSYNINIQG